MKYSNFSFERLMGEHKRARHKIRENQTLEQYFENPIIHREIQGEHVYVPLNLNKVWNGVY
ncbi:hypothetical protein [Neobacillus mesonae]|uniref:hypothetical protein n=1 Tax=Neobacillus mesonae TaxID=1193713 RepID=UPI0020425F1E|nr:hypothetical protein [Neobacillus mesonae]MCM3570514.1 hypothetical protein [Neobacillus mesonae]